MASEIKDITFTFIGRIVNAILVIIIQSCLAWFLLPDGRGSYAICLIYTTILTMLFSFGSDTAFIYFVASKRLNISESITYSILIGFVVSILSILIGFAVLQLPLSFTSKATPSDFHLALFYCPVFLLANIYIQLLTSLGQFYIYSILIVLREVNRLTFILIFVLWLSLGVKGALLANIISDFVMIFITLGLYKLKYHLNLVKPRLIHIRKILSYGMRYYFGRLSNLLNVQIGTIILAFFASKEEIGLFAVATALTVRIEMIPDSFFPVLFQRVANNKTDKLELIAQCARITGMICSTLLIILALFANPIIEILFSSDFLPSVNLVRILIIGTMARCVSKMFVPYILGTNHPGIASISVVIGLLTNIVMMYSFLPVYGLSGAAISVSMNYLISSLILTVSFIHLSGVTIQDLFVFRQSDWEQVYFIMKRYFKKA